MRILVICQYYYPEQFRINDICEELVCRGHEVTVITGVPNYPKGEIYKGYEHGERKDEIINGVRVHRCFTVPRKKGTFFRVLNYFSYALSSSIYVKVSKFQSQKEEQFDVVLVNQLSPVMMGYAAIQYKKKYKVPVVHYCLDLWPVSLEVSGMKRTSLIYKLFKYISKYIYEKADYIAVSSMSFIEYLKKLTGRSESDIVYLPQYAEDIFIDDNLSKKQDGHYDFGFAGNIGQLQSVETIVETAKLLANREDITFHIVGDGISLNKCKEMAKGLSNIIFYGRQPLESMPEFYKKMDAMLVTMIDNDLVCTVMPGKVQSYMAAGKPVIGAINGETDAIIKRAGCGYCCEAEQPTALKEDIISFINDKEKEKLGRNGKRFYNDFFTKDKFFDCLTGLLEKGIEKFEKCTYCGRTLR